MHHKRRAPLVAVLPLQAAVTPLDAPPVAGMVAQRLQRRPEWAAEVDKDWPAPPPGICRRTNDVG
jgi:hypothetical protein